MPQMVFFVLSVQRILPGRVQHGQLLPGHAGHHCDVAAAGADGQRPAVCIVEDKSGIGPLRPCDVPQPPAVQPYTAAKGKVVVQRKAVVPQAGRGVEDQKIIEPGRGSFIIESKQIRNLKRENRFLCYKTYAFE